MLRTTVSDAVAMLIFYIALFAVFAGCIALGTLA